MTCDLLVDIDFDYCVRPTIAEGRTNRSDHISDLRVWLSDADFAEWLAARGLLNPDTFAGVVEQHHEVLPIWADLLATRRLRPPFGVLHIDAHPDLMDLDDDDAAAFDDPGMSPDRLLSQARAGNFLQFPVRLGWVNAIWMLFPDDECDRIAALGGMSPAEVSSIVRKPVSKVSPTKEGGVELTVTIGSASLEVALHTRASLSPLPPPKATVLTHSPEFVPPSADTTFRALCRRLKGEIC